MDDGYIRIYRTILDSQVWHNEGLFKVWVWCLLKATYKERWVPISVGKGVTEVKVMPGQFIYGREAAAKELKMNQSSVRNRMEKLKNIGNLDIQPDRHYSIITVINWDRYQLSQSDIGQPIGLPEDSRRTAVGQPQDTNNKVKKVKKVNNIKPMSFWPDDFTLTDRLRAMASKYIPADKIDSEWEAFRAWALSGNKQSANWESSWTTRYVNYAKYNKPAQTSYAAKQDALLGEFD